MEEQSSEKKSSSYGDSEKKSSSHSEPKLSVVNMRALHETWNDLEDQAEVPSNDKGKENEKPKKDDKGKEREKPKKRGGTVPVHPDLLTKFKKNADESANSDRDFIIVDLDKGDPKWDIHPDQVFRELIRDPEKFIPEDMRTALQKALEEVNVLTKQENSAGVLGRHMLQEFGVFVYAYVPFAVALVTSWACFNYGGMSEEHAKVLAAFMGGFGDILNGKLLHNAFRWNNTMPTSWARDKVDEQVKLARDKIANAIAKCFGVKPDLKDLKIQAKAFPLGKWEFMMNELAAYMSDGLSMTFFAINLMVGQPLSMAGSTLAWQLVVGALLSGVGIAVMMGLRMLTEYFAHQPRVQMVDLDNTYDALLVTLQDVIKHLQTQRIQAHNMDLDTRGIDAVLKGYEEQLAEAKERLAKRPPAKPSTLAGQRKLFVKDGPLTFTQVAGHTFGFMLWPLGAYYFGMPAVAAGLVGCALGIGGRQEWAYALQIVGAPLQGVYRGLRQCCRNAEEEDEEAGNKKDNKKDDQIVHIPSIQGSSNHS